MSIQIFIFWFEFISCNSHHPNHLAITTITTTLFQPSLELPPLSELSLSYYNHFKNILEKTEKQDSIVEKKVIKLLPNFPINSTQKILEMTEKHDSIVIQSTQ